MLSYLPFILAISLLISVVFFLSFKKIIINKRLLLLIILLACIIRLVIMLRLGGINDAFLYLKTTDELLIGNHFDMYRIEFCNYTPQYMNYQEDPGAIWKANATYPPLFFLLFAPLLWLAKFFGPERVPNLFFVMKLPLFIADFLCAWLVYKIVKERWGLQKGRMALTIWLLNPLVIWNSAVSGHFESLILVFLLLTYRNLNSWLKASLFLSLALLTKHTAIIFLLPLIFLPVTRYSLKEKIFFLSVTGIIFVGIMAPFYFTTPQAVENALFGAIRDRPPILFTPWIFTYPSQILRYNGQIVLLGVALTTFLMRKERDIMKIFLALTLAMLILSKVITSHYYVPLILFSILAGFRLRLLIGALFSFHLLSDDMRIIQYLWDSYWGPIHLFSLVTMINFLFLVALFVLVMVPRYEKRLFERVSV